MRIRYRNRSTGEARDINVGSAEETTVKTEVFTVNGESLPLWVLDAEYKQIMAEEANMSTAVPVFGHHSRRLTPGEIAMGISSYEQKVRENTQDDNAVYEEADDEEIIDSTTTEAVNPADAHHDESEDEDDEDIDEVDDDEEGDDDDKHAATAPKKRQPRRAPRRAPARSR